MSSLISVRDLHVDYATEEGLVRAVRGISFDVGVGETFALVGESGSGKSTVALALLSLLPRAGRSSGGVVWDDKELIGPDSIAGLRGREIGIVFQDPGAYLNPVISIGEQISETVRHHLRLSRRAAKDRTLELLSSVGIHDPRSRFDDYPHQFSGGMRQRAMLAIALSCGPRLLIADEPTTALDVTIGAQILDLISKLQAESNMSLLLITHDLGVVARLANRVAVMYGGLLMEVGSVDEVLGTPSHPYTSALLGSIPRLRRPVTDRLVAIEGAPPDLLAPPPGCPFEPRCPRRFDACRVQPPLTLVSVSQRSACWLHVPEAGREVVASG